jgi:hypothetical protein
VGKPEPDFDVDFRVGLEAEEAYKAFLLGTHEVKLDRGVARTGNHYVETWQQNRHGEYQSGVNTTKADYWVLASPIGTGFVGVRVDALKWLISEVDPPVSRQPILSERTNSSTGRLVRLDDLLWVLGMRSR